MRPIYPLLAAVLTIAPLFPAHAQSAPLPIPISQPSPTARTKAPVERFFDAFGRGDLVALLDTLHPDVTFKVDGDPSVPWYGTYHGHDGARTFLTRLGENTRTQAFTVTTLIAERDTVLASGHLRHLIPQTNKAFDSDWALVCRIQDDKIVSYHFFENTAAARAAFQP